MAMADVDVGRKMAINIYQWCQDLCSWTLLNGPDIKLGGPGQIVQIDESVFTHQGKVCHTSVYICMLLYGLYILCSYGNLRNYRIMASHVSHAP